MNTPKQPVTRRNAIILSSLTILTLTACSGARSTPESGSQPSTTPAGGTSEPPSPPTETPTPTSTPSATASTAATDPSTPPTNSVNEGGDPSTTPGGTGPTNTQGRDLTRADLFNPPLNLKEDLYNVATTRSKKGIGATLRNSDGVEAELRLENRFNKLTFSAGQDNNSESSDLILRIEIFKDGKSDQFFDIPFNEIKPIEVNVKDVNALKIDLIPFDQNGQKYNGSKTLTGVMFDMRLE